MKNQKIIQLILSFPLVLLLTSCTSNGSNESLTPGASYLVSNSANNNDSSDDTRVNSSATNSNLKNVTKFNYLTPEQEQLEDLASRFSENEMVSMTIDKLAIKDFSHYVLGEILAMNYVLDEEMQSDTRELTLNLTGEVSKRRLFSLSQELLEERGYVIRHSEDIYYIHKSPDASSEGDITYGYGQNSSDVPNSSSTIVQMVPLKFGMQTTLAHTLKKLTKIQAEPNFERNSLLLKGKRRAILRSLEFIQLMDQPNFRDRHVGTYSTNYVSVSELEQKLPELLLQDGITIGKGKQTDKALSLISIDRISTLVIFANDQALLERAVFWAKKLDQPASGDELQYYVYQPTYSRASDLGESIKNLLPGANVSGPSKTTSAKAENKSSAATDSSGLAFTSSNGTALVVDERANALIVYTTGGEYRKLLPLIKRLDVLPKQVMLEMMIAEVTLTDQFKRGVEFELTSGNYAVSTSGALMGENGFGGLSYVLTGTKGKIALNLFQNNDLVNVISKPSLVVRDGVQASITVGSDIPVVGQTASDPISGERQTTSVEYRKTGVELNVMPTVNAQGVVIMEINQKISNVVPDSAGAGGNSAIFERSIATEVVADSGQTVILGGLISENLTEGENKVPFFSDSPLIGGLFTAEEKQGDKTELVVLVTPRIIDSSDDWDDVKAKFDDQLEKIQLY